MLYPDFQFWLVSQTTAPLFTFISTLFLDSTWHSKQMDVLLSMNFHTVAQFTATFASSLRPIAIWFRLKNSWIQFSHICNWDNYFRWAHIANRFYIWPCFQQIQMDANRIDSTWNSCLANLIQNGIKWIYFGWFWRCVRSTVDSVIRSGANRNV